MKKRKTAVLVGFLALMVVSVAWYRHHESYPRSQERLLQMEMNHVVDDLNRCQLVRDSLEGKVLGSGLLKGIMTTDGRNFNLDSLLEEERQTSLILLFSERGCNRCVLQEIELIEQDTFLAESNGLRVFYISSGDVRSLQVLRRARLLKHLILSDPTDALRCGIGLQDVSPIEMVLSGRRIVYATSPSAGAVARSLSYLRRVHSLIQINRD